MPEPRDTPRPDPSLGRLVFDDLRGGNIAGTLGRDFRDLYRFYVDPERRERLERMGRVRRTFWVLGWLLKSLLLKLSPARRVLILLSLVLTILGPTRLAIRGMSLESDFRPWGYLVLLFVLMLELKDKLVARDEIQIAREVQRALLPTEPLRMPGWNVWCHSVAANDVGGDLVDYVQLDPERYGIGLGDVSGKGLGAALLSAKLQATLRALAPDSPSLDDLATRLNGILHKDGLANRFATLFYVELSPYSGHVRYLNAGHNPPLLLRDHGDVELLGASSYPLGMFPNGGYSEGEVDFAPGDTVVIYSDGLTEAVDAAGREFGTERLEALAPALRGLAPEAAGRRILEEVEGFLDGERPQDDLSLVVVRRDAPAR